MHSIIISLSCPLIFQKAQELDGLDKKLSEILEKADYLGLKTKHLAEENRSLKEKLSKATQDGKVKEQEMEEMRRQFEILKMAKNLGEGGGNEKVDELKSKINEYIREIDQCLKLIGDWARHFWNTTGCKWKSTP